MKKVIGLLACMISSMALAQSLVDVDPQHVKVMFENDCVTVVHGKYGPGEQAAGPYQGPGSAVIALTDLKLQRNRDGAQPATITRNAGDAFWASPGKVTSLVNLSDAPSEWIAVTPKGKAGCEK
jgi:hypothetical protein